MDKIQKGISTPIGRYVGRWNKDVKGKGTIYGNTKFTVR